MSTITDKLSYPFDPTGTATTNKITSEKHILTATNWSDYSVIVPDYAPFYADSLKLVFRDVNGMLRILKEGVDWYPTHHFIGASRATAKAIYGSITFLDTTLAGEVELAEYQTIGGTWVLPTDKVSELLANIIHNPRTTSWEHVSGIPNVFPVIAHEWNLVDMVGVSEVVEGIHGIEEQLRATGQQGLADHIANKNNPHGVTAEQINLGSVQNFPMATISEAVAATAGDRYMSPVTTSALINAQANSVIAAHQADRNNPHGTTAHQVGAYTSQEVDAIATTKLDKNAAAVDSAKVYGLLYPELQTRILEGTAANSIKLGGKTLLQVVEMAQGGAAANATQLDGLNLEEVKEYILGSGTAYDSSRIAGRTWTQLLQTIAESTVHNANNLGGRSLTDIKAEIKSEGVDNAARFGGLTPIEFTAATLQGTVANSIKFGGKTYVEAVEDFTSRTVANANRLENKTLAEVVAMSAAASTNALTLEGLSSAQIISTATNAAIAGAVGSNGELLDQITALSLRIVDLETAMATLTADVDSAFATITTSINALSAAISQ